MKLTVLMWKHMKARYRHYCITISELLFPILILCLAYVVNTIIYNSTKSPPSKRIYPNTMYMDPPKQVLYYPPTEVTNKIMDLVGENLNLSRLNSFPGRYTAGYYGVYNLSTIENFLDMSEQAALVVFQELSNLTDKLNYTIKMRNKLKQNINILERVSTQPLGQLHEPVISLQWAIDNAYLYLKHGLRSIQGISIEPLNEIENVKARIHSLLGMHLFCFMSMGFVFMFHVSRVMTERVSGIQAIITMAGVSPALYNLSHLLNAMLFSLIYTGEVVLFLVMTYQFPAMVQSSNLLLVAVMVFAYYLSIVMMGFFTCYLLSHTRHVMSAAAGFYGLSYLPSLFLYKVKVERPYLQIMLGLLPHVSMDWFWGHLAHLETSGTGLNPDTMIEYNSSNVLQPYIAYVMMVVQIVTFSLATYYFSLVRPGKFTSPLPWDFMFDKAFWSGAKLHCDVELIADLQGPSEKYRNYFEPRPLRRHIGIRIVNVSKIYSTTIALQKITLNIQRGEIYVLLGHNGAGKTTLLNIIAGMEQATTGKVYVNGLDVSTNTSTVKRLIGVCPQQNILIPELNVIEHIIFFTMIRQNVSFNAARLSAIYILNQLGLEKKSTCRLCDTTADVIRRLQLGCAIAGETDVLILDEPTSGLNVEARRRLWNLLLTLKQNRTVLLTTHFMEEADALGDRVAALHVGRLRCDATPMFLKHAVGKGYRLTLMTIGSPKVSDIMQKVFSEVPEANFKEAAVNCVMFDLPPDSKDKFSKLFDTLELHRDELNVQSIGIGTITLEEVFLRLCSDVHVTFRKVDAGVTGPAEPRAKGFQLYKNQLSALWRRQKQYYLAYKYSFLLLEVIVPVFMLAFLTVATNALKSNRPSRQFSVFSLDLTAYNGLPNKKVLLHLDKMALRHFSPKFEDIYDSIEFDFVPDLNKVVLQLNDENPTERGNVLFGIDVNETNAKILYSTMVRNSAPLAVNLLANMLAERSRPNPDSPEIYTYIEPIGEQNDSSVLHRKQKIKSQSDIFNWALFVSLVIIATVIHSVTSLSREQLSGTRRIFIIYGCSPILYWLFTWLFHTLFYIVILVIPALVITMLFEGDQTLDQVRFRAAFCTTLVIGLMAHLALMYLISLYSKETTVIIVGSVFMLVFGMVTPTCHTITKDHPDCCGVFSHFMAFIDYVMPTHTFTMNLLKAGKVARMNALCKLLRRTCPNVHLPIKLDATFDMKKCCATTDDMQCYFCLEENGLGGRFIRGAAQSTLYMTLVLLSQLGLFNGIWDKIINRNYKTKPATSDDPLVRREINHVNNALRLTPDRTHDIALVQNLHKRYCTLGHSTVAVQGVTFSVKKGECFGIVGLSGSGKTTIIQMLVGAECITRGKVVCNGIPARVGRSTIVSTQYLQTLGYCSQNHNLDDFRTAEENLSTLLKLQGYNSRDVKKGVENWLRVVSLEKHVGKRVWAYSGGCKRRLAAAAAMMSGGELTLLDEPTAGIDVSARREVWLALSEGLRGERAALVTSSTMADIEALCDRVCILVDGQIKALATPTELRATQDDTYLLQFFLNTDQETTTPESLRLIDMEVRQIFDCKLIDGHRSMLQYRISRALPYSEIFNESDQLQNRHKGLILAYTIREPMLQEVFLALVTKGQKKEKGRRKSWFRYSP